jgi:hypothetical protein
VLSNRRKALCILLWVLELVNGGLTLAIAYTAYASKTIFVFIARWSWLVSSAVILAVVVRAFTLPSGLCADSWAHVDRRGEHWLPMLVHVQDKRWAGGVHSLR